MLTICKMNTSTFSQTVSQGTFHGRINYTTKDTFINDISFVYYVYVLCTIICIFANFGEWSSFR